MEGSTKDSGKEGQAPPAFDLKTVVPAVIGSLTAIGWVTFVGGAITWISFDKASLPAAEATARVPTSVLVSTGAEFLVFAVAAALVVAGVMSLLGYVDKKSSDTAKKLTLSELESARLAAERVHRDALRARSAAREEVAKVSTQRQRADGELAKLQREGASEGQLATSESAAKAAADAVDDKQAALERAETAEVAAKTKLDAAEQKLREARSLHSAPGAWAIFMGILLMAVSVAAILIVDLGYGTDLGGWEWFLIGLSVLILGTAGSLAYLMTARWPAIVVAAVLGVPLVMGIASGLRISSAPQVEPVALLTTEGRPLVGFFVSQNDKEVVIGTYEEVVGSSKLPPSLQTIARDKVASVLVGPRLPLFAKQAADNEKTPRTAREWAGKAAIAMCVRTRQTPPPEPPVTPAPPSTEETTGATVPAPLKCTREDLQTLRSFVSTEVAFIEAPPEDDPDA